MSSGWGQRLPLPGNESPPELPAAPADAAAGDQHLREQHDGAEGRGGGGVPQSERLTGNHHERRERDELHSPVPHRPTRSSSCIGTGIEWCFNVLVSSADFLVDA